MIKRNQDLTLPQEAKPDMPFVQILDPATGTGTFLIEVIDLIHKYMTDKWREEGKNEKQISALWNEYVPKHLLPRLNGFELMMAPYAIAHIKLAMKLHETGYRPKEGGPRVRVFLTNSLEEALGSGKQIASALLTLAEEAKGANEIKAHTPITIVIGNPPYSGVSMNMTSWSNDLIKGAFDDSSYYKIDGQNLGERKTWLQDDYVKFTKYAQLRIGSSGVGVIGFITNHAFLDNPTFRGMRQSIMKTYEKLDFIDLHGNSKRGEKSPDGSPDKNVFNIQQGVAITIGRSLPRFENKIKISDIYGEHRRKNSSLEKRQFDFSKNIFPVSPFYFFREIDETNRSDWELMISVKDIFPLSNTGIVTMGDSFILSKKKQELDERLNDFLANKKTENQLKKEFSLGKNYPKWILGNKKTISLDKKKFEKILLRPFDVYWTYFDKNLIWRCRENIMRHMREGPNIGLITVRQQSQQETWAYAGITTTIMESGAISNKTREINYLFPLYLYEENMGETRIRANLAPGFTQSLAEATGLAYDSFVEHEQEHLNMPGVGTRQAKNLFS